MNYQEKCDHCGHTNTAYTYSLNKGKVAALRSLVDQYEAKKRPIQMAEMNLTTSQYTNFCHLQYFRLVQHTADGWVPTPDGSAFIHGEIPVLLPAGVMNGQILPDDHEAWKTHEGQRSKAFIFDIDETAYKKKPEYAAEKSGSLFG